jgi:hypothetical protein
MKEFVKEAKTLIVQAGVRYWDDATINGIKETEDGLNTPCKESDIWRLVIDIDTGVIVNWTQGTTASVHYKVCDAGSYIILDEFGNPILEKKGYVPDILDLTRHSYGDYIILDIKENGQIAGWIKSEKNKMFDTDVWKPFSSRMQCWNPSAIVKINIKGDNNEQSSMA